MAFYIERFKGVEAKEFEVEIVTPLFLGGADPKKAELRVPSIKGALRFWWRAIYAHLSLNVLKEQESKIFGDAGDIYGKSKVHIKICNTLIYNGNDRYNPVPHKNVRFSFPCFSPGQSFSLKICGDKKSFDLLKLVSVLGGLGKRSRRGFGSFVIKKIDGIDFCFDYTADNTLKLLDNIQEGVFGLNNGKIIRMTEAHKDGEYAYIKEIEFGDGSSGSYHDILKKIGLSSHNNKSDYTGYAGRGNERFSSPVYVSVVKISDKYRPIITTLNTAFEKRNQNHGIDRSSSFKKEILSGGSQ